MPGTCAAGQSSLTFNGSGVASGFNITLFDAQTTALTVSPGTSTGTSANITVSADTRPGLIHERANRNGPVTVRAPGAIATLTCAASADNKAGNASAS